MNTPIDLEALKIMANARLIAAAPQLYAELVEARKQRQEIRGR